MAAGEELIIGYYMIVVLLSHEVLPRPNDGDSIDLNYSADQSLKNADHLGPPPTDVDTWVDYGAETYESEIDVGTIANVPTVSSVHPIPHQVDNSVVLNAPNFSSPMIAPESERYPKSRNGDMGNPRVLTDDVVMSEWSSVDNMADWTTLQPDSVANGRSGIGTQMDSMIQHQPDSVGNIDTVTYEPSPVLPLTVRQSVSYSENPGDDLSMPTADHVAPHGLDSLQRISPGSAVGETMIEQDTVANSHETSIIVESATQSSQSMNLINRDAVMVYTNESSTSAPPTVPGLVPYLDRPDEDGTMQTTTLFVSLELESQKISQENTVGGTMIDKEMLVNARIDLVVHIEGATQFEPYHTVDNPVVTYEPGPTVPLSVTTPVSVSGEEFINVQTTDRSLSSQWSSPENMVDTEKVFQPLPDTVMSVRVEWETRTERTTQPNPIVAVNLDVNIYVATPPQSAAQSLRHSPLQQLGTVVISTCWLACSLMHLHVKYYVQ